MTIARILARIVVIDVLFSLKLAAILKTCVSVSAPLRLNRPRQSNMHGAANILILFVLHQYIGAADQLAPIYW
jgi:hypothetical protein